MSETDPVKYFQSETKRLNYYNSQFLKEEDFRDEQLYHGQMRRFHNRSLHTWGVVAGLDVSQVAGAKQVKIAPGTAIDRLGREIVLPREFTLPQQGGLTQDAVSFDAFDASSQVYLTINYGEATDQADRDAQGNNYTRTVERPKFALSVSAPADGDAGVVLATITLDKDKSIAKVGTELRRYAGSRIGSSSDGKEFSIYADPTGAWHFFDGAKGADRLTIGGNGCVGIGTTPTATRLSVYSDVGKNYEGNLADFVIGGRYKLGLRYKSPGDSMVAYHFDLVNNIGRYDSFLVFDRGNVGIGASSPISQLHIRNDAAGTCGPVLTLMNGGGSAGAGAAIDFYTYDQSTAADYDPLKVSPMARIQSEDDGKFSNALLFLTKTPGTNMSQLEERMRISSTGNVGIGTAKPGAKLTLGGPDSTTSIETKEVLRLLRPAVTSVKNSNSAGFLIGASETGIDAKARLDIALSGAPQDSNGWGLVPDVTVMSLLGNGNVGIGTSDPGKSKLRITSGTDFANFRFDSAGAGELLFVAWTNGWNIDTMTAGKHLYINRDANDNSDVLIGHVGRELTIKGDTGNVGIGNTSPNNQLEVYGPAGKHPGKFGTPDGYVKLGPANGGWCHFETDRPKFWFNTGIWVNTGNIGSYGDSNFNLITGDLGARMTIMHDTGNVGIGTTAPTQAKLVVNGAAQQNFGQYYFLAGGRTFANTGLNTMPADQTAGYSIYTSDRIAASEFNGFSDERIKKIHGRSDSAADLRTLLGIEITDYQHKDAIGKGSAPHKKVIGQQVEKVFPQAVSRHIDVVPDIYQPSSIHDGWVALPSDLKKGERVKLIAEEGGEGVYEVLEATGDRFRVAFGREAERVFVYGREVNDFLTVDYDAIAMLNVSATQQIKKETDEEVKQLRSEIAELRAANDVLSSRLELLERGERAASSLVAKTPNGNGRH